MARAISSVSDSRKTKSRTPPTSAACCPSAKGTPVYRVAAQAHARAVPLLPVLEFLRTFFGIDERDTDRAARERIASRLLDLDASFDDDLPLVFDFLSVPAPDRPVERLDPEARQRRLLHL